MTANQNGIITTNISDTDSEDYAFSAIVQPDGRLVVAGVSNRAATLVRYNINGSLDTTFDGDGKVVTDFGFFEAATSLIAQPDGKLVVAGWTPNGSDNDFALARYNADGSLDDAFGGAGKVTTDIGGSNDYAEFVAVQLDGKLVVAGRSHNSINGDGDFALVRYNTDGSLDSSFDGDGKLTTAIGSSLDTPVSVIIQPDGKLVGSSRFRGVMAAYRYLDAES